MPEIQNPNLQTQGSGGGGGGGDMRSTMAFMLLAMAAIFGYQYFFMKPKPEPQPPAQTNPIAARCPGRSVRAGPGATCRDVRAALRGYATDRRFYRDRHHRRK